MLETEAGPDSPPPTAPKSATSFITSPEQILDKTRLIAERVLKAGNAFGRISKTELSKIMVEFGIPNENVVDIMRELPGTSVSLSELVEFQKHGSVSISDVIEDQRFNIPLFAGIIFFCEQLTHYIIILSFFKYFIN